MLSVTIEKQRRKMSANQSKKPKKNKSAVEQVIQKEEEYSEGEFVFRWYHLASLVVVFALVMTAGTTFFRRYDISLINSKRQLRISFGCTEGDAEPEDDTGVTYDEEGTPEYSNIQKIETSTSSIVDNGTDANVVDPYVIQTVYEESKVEKVGSSELIEDQGLKGNIATQVVNPTSANFAVGGDLNYSAALDELAKLLGDDGVIVIPQLPPTQLLAFGSGLSEGLFGGGPGGTHTNSRHDTKMGDSSRRYVVTSGILQEI